MSLQAREPNAVATDTIEEHQQLESSLGALQGAVIPLPSGPWCSQMTTELRASQHPMKPCRPGLWLLPQPHFPHSSLLTELCHTVFLQTLSLL